MTSPASARIPITTRALLGLYLYRAVAGLVVGYPVARTLGALGPSSRPDGDLGLFLPTGMQLLEALRLGARVLPASLESATVSTIALALGGLVPLSLALADMVSPRSTRRERWATAADCTPTLIFLSGATLLVQALLGVVTRLVIAATAALTDPWSNERAQDLVPLGVGLVGVLSVLAAGVVQDLARAAAVRHGTRGLESAKLGVAALIRAPRAALAGFVGPIVGTAIVVLGAAAATGSIDVSRPGATRIAGVLLVHQATIVVIVALRLRALGVALALVAPPGATTDGRPESDGAEGPADSTDGALRE